MLKSSWKIYHYRDYAIEVSFEGDDIALPRIARYHCQKNQSAKPGPTAITGEIDGHRDSIKDLHARAIRTAQSHVDQYLGPLSSMPIIRVEDHGSRY